MKPKYLNLFASSIFLLFFLAFGGCRKCHKTDFPETVEKIPPTNEDLTWIPDKNGDTIIFKNNYGVYDTLFAGLSKQPWYDPYLQGEYSSCEKYTSYGYCQDIWHINNPYANVSVINTPNTKGNLSPKLEWKNYVISAKITIVGNTIDGVVINGKNYNNVFVFYADSNKTLNSNEITWRIYYQKEKGVLRYDQKGGISWERVK